MARELKFQDPGEGIHEGEITDVLVSVGDEVQEGDNILVVETDKATTDLPSPFSGKVEEIRVKKGDVVEVGDVMVTFTGGDEEADDEKKKEEEQEEETADQQAEREKSETAEREAEQRREEKEERQKKGEQKKAKKEKEDEEKKGEQKSRRRSGGKAAAVGELPEYEEKKKKAKKQQPAEKKEAERPVPASPATRRLARELDVDLSDVEPSGPHGRVIDDDVRAAAERKPTEKKAAEEKPAEEKKPARAPERPSLPNFEQWGPVEREPLRGVRRQTARRMTLSWQEIPHVTHHDLVDITELERWRRKKAPEIEQTGGRLSLMVLVMKALASVLTRHPRFNASLDPDAQELILKRYCHLGVAVDTDDGLVVGVVRDVDQQSIGRLAGEVDKMVERVRSRKVSSEDLRGSTFTVTNVGPLGGVAFEPLVNYPEVAILGMARARLQQVVTGDFDAPETAVRYMLPLSLSYDHRVNDGADAARFITDLGESLHDPDALLLNV